MLHRGESTPERRVRKALEFLGVEYIQEHPIGRYSIDFYLPRQGIALEVDGEYWHRGREDRDGRRDRQLLDAHNIRTIRICETDVMRSKRLGSALAKLLGLADAQLSLW